MQPTHNLVSLSCVQLFATARTVARQAPLSMDSLGNTAVGCHFPLQGIFLTQGLTPQLFCLLRWQAHSSPLRHQGSPTHNRVFMKLGNCT